jgi:hypothetical protein
MYKPKKPENTNRLRLDIEPKLPSIYVVEGQFQEAKSRRGCLVELPFKGMQPGQLYILGVQWDSGGDLPVWTLYDQNGSESKMLWSEQYAPQDIAIMYDVVVMSTSGMEPSGRIPDSLKPVTASTPSPPMDIQPPPQQAPMPGYPPPGYPPPPPYPGMPAPGQPYGYPVDAQGMPYPYQYYPMPPQPMPGQMPGQPGQPVPYPGWPYPPMPMPGMMPDGTMVAPGQAPVQPAPSQPPPAQTDPVTGLPLDYSLISKRAKVQLGKLLVDSKIIAESTLDAALKMQELVEEEKLSAEQAPVILQRHHLKGAAIEQYLQDTAPEIKAEPLPPPDPERIRQAQKLPINPPRSTAEGKAAFDFLQQAGILTENDIKTAQAVRAKHGGDLIRILQAAGKLDKYTFESAVTCLPMIREGLMKVEQCVLVVQYCNRVRVDFDSAMDELNWPNPRKLRKDLPL